MPLLYSIVAKMGTSHCFDDVFLIVIRRKRIFVFNEHFFFVINLKCFSKFYDSCVIFSEALILHYFWSLCFSPSHTCYRVLDYTRLSRKTFGVWSLTSCKKKKGERVFRCVEVINFG